MQTIIAITRALVMVIPYCYYMWMTCLLQKSSIHEINNLKKLLKKFKLKDLGAAKQILRVTIDRDKKAHTMKFSHMDYVKNVLSIFNMQDH